MTLTTCSFTVYQGDCVEDDDMFGRGVGRWMRIFKFKMLLEDAAKSRYCLFLARHPPVGQGLLIHQGSRSHTTTHHSR